MKVLDTQSHLDFKIVRNATILILTFSIPLIYVHEFGHAIVCAADGFSYDLHIGLVSGYLNCHGTPTDLTLFHFSGGILAMSVSLVPFSNWKWIRKNKAVMIACLSFAIGHGLNAIIETVFYNWYVEQTSLASIPINIVSFGSFIGLLVLFGRSGNTGGHR